MIVPSPSLPVQMLGLPTDRNSSFLKGARKAPMVVRHVMKSGMSNLTAENGCDLNDPHLFMDLRDLDLKNDESDFREIKKTARTLFTKGPALFVGGDHFITWPVMEGLAASRGISPHLVQVDAHPDLYPAYEGNASSHASVMSRILDRSLVAGLTQIGIRTSDKVQRSRIDRYGVTVFPTSQGLPVKKELPEGPTYLTIDLDGLDPAFAPGVSHHEPGGLSVLDVITLIWALPGPLIGGDIVEYNPVNDINGMTAAVVLKLIKELTARIVSDHPAGT